MPLSEETLRLHSIIRPHSSSIIFEAIRKRTNFVHYTSAENALSILETRSVWMRNVRCMNDFSEVEHGVNLLNNFFDDPAQKDAFFSAVNSCHADVAEEAVELFNGWYPSIRSNTYITCISEHDPTEDELGRLSMWRAYRGGSVGVALVFNAESFFNESDALKAYSSPVSYLSDKDFQIDMINSINMINKNIDLLKNTNRSEFMNIVFMSIILRSICSKHQGFSEEREWRIFHSPDIHQKSPLVRSIETVAHIPQPIFKIPLKNIPEEGLTGIEIPELLNRVIIGPSEYPRAISDAFAETLAKRGVEDPASKIFISHIPIRD